MITRPPVRVEPEPEESVPSMLARLAGALGVRHRSLLGGGRSGLYFSNPGWILSGAAEVLGVSVDVLRSHTLDGRLDPRLTAAMGPSLEFRHRSWLACPACATGSLWTPLVLVTACAACGVLLAPGPRDEDGPRPRPVTAPPEALAMQRAYLHFFQADGAGPELVDLHARFDRVTRLRKFWRRASRTAAAGPPRGADSPEVVADFAVHAWPASVSEEATVAFIAETMRQRLPNGRSPDRGGVTAARAALHQMLVRVGISDQHVPTYLLPDKPLVQAMPYDLDIGLATSRALRREARHAHHGARPAGYLLDRGGPLSNRHEASTLDRHLENTAAGLDTLTALAQELASGGAVDYVERTATLATLRRAPSGVLSHCITRSLDPELAAVWIRLQLTAHPPRESWLLSDVAAFDHTLNPEDRLTLLEYGHQVLTAVTDDLELAVAAQTSQSRPAAGFRETGHVS